MKKNRETVFVFKRVCFCPTEIQHKVSFFVFAVAYKFPYLFFAFPLYLSFAFSEIGNRKEKAHQELEQHIN